MKIWSNSLLLVFSVYLSLLGKVTAQSPVPGQWLIQVHPNASIENLNASVQRRINAMHIESRLSSDSAGHLASITLVSKTLNIWLFKSTEGDDGIYLWLTQQPEVVTVQSNHYLTVRSNVLPNDPLFALQWQYLNDGSSGGTVNADLDADLAWGSNTGGLSVAGDTIVVAVIDGGVNSSHPDLEPNLWKNWDEIPDDGVDNDQNGYIDDFFGWNVFTLNDNIQGATTIHGTPVCGIIGAAGNNGTGITGINWNIKLMFVTVGNLESDLISAYDYILNARRKYNQTNGTAGAFVVASNCSWGIDYGLPADAPLWCAAYEALGQEGILNVTATANNPVDVDLVGDLPTTCPSDYLIAVTSLDMFDQKAPNAAWGATHIDLGAYGEGVFSTSANHQYGIHSGTSFAAPQVAGAIGLLYASPFPELIALAKTDPKAAALWSKQLLLNSVVPNVALAESTLSGGRLNLFHLMQHYQQQCASCPPPFGLQVSSATPYSAALKWHETADFQSVTIKWRVAGNPNWSIAENVSSIYLLEGLMPCTNYEVALRSTCSNGDISEWSSSLALVTKGCCEAPSFSWGATATANSATVSWTSLLDFNAYKILIHETGTSSWQVFLTVDTALLVPNLNPCTNYEWVLQGWCLDSWVYLTQPYPFQTLGCGACSEQPYCMAGGGVAEEEWIASVQVGPWLHHSGGGGGGYQNLTSVQTTNPEIYPQSAIDLILTPGFWGNAYKEYFRVYIDFNLDGDFEDTGELAFDPGFAQEGVVYGTLTIPPFSEVGTTRMRILMKYAESNGTPPEACGLFPFGQVEDYCVDLRVAPAALKMQFDSTRMLNIFPQPAGSFVFIEAPDVGSNLLHMEVWDISGCLQSKVDVFQPSNNTLSVDTMYWPSGIYFVAVASKGKVYRGKLVKG